MPCTTVAGPVLTTARSAAGVIVVVTDEVLLAVFVSSTPAGGLTVAVFVKVPTVVAVPVTVTVIELPPPALSCTALSAMPFPVPVAPVPATPVSQSAVPATEHVHETAVRLLGTASAICAAVTLLLPALVIVSV